MDASTQLHFAYRIAMNQTLDVRSMAPRGRHLLIFRTLDDLRAGDAVEPVNDHDPKS